MSKKMLTLAISLASIAAFAAPAAAQAVTLTGGEGPIKAGAEVVAVSSDVTVPVGGGVSIHCAAVTVNGETFGEGPEISSVAGPGAAEGCEFYPLGAPYTITSFELSIDFDAATADLAYTYDSPVIGAKNCKMVGTDLGATFGGESDVVSISGGPLKGSGSNCPQGAAGFTGSFALEDPNAGNTPLYVS